MLAKRSYYGLACDNPRYSVNELQVLEQIQYLFCLDKHVTMSEIMDPNLSTMIDSKLRVDLRFFCISNEKFKIEEQTANRLKIQIKTNVVISQGPYMPENKRA